MSPRSAHAVNPEEIRRDPAVVLAVGFGWAKEGAVEFGRDHPTWKCKTENSVG